MKDQANEGLVLPVWNSYECVVLDNAIKEGTIDELVLDTNKIYAVCGSEKIVKVVFEGESVIKDTSDDDFYYADESVEYVLRYKANSCVAYSGLVGLVELV